MLFSFCRGRSCVVTVLQATSKGVPFFLCRQKDRNDSVTGYQGICNCRELVCVG